ncbi:allophanate hydrolase subunit 1 [Pseudahrensia aquimaris]|uniref:Allophanate hydrolase subunit 1 n=1 Tax=Pseudahrensia aquimaris TaxID=744461 RepID=A0ABW3FDS1_9HYPH
MKPHFTPVADSAVLVTFGKALGEDVFQSIVAFDKALQQSPPSGMVEAVPALVNVLGIFDPVQTDHVELQVALEKLLSGMSRNVLQTQNRVVQVCYDGPYAPDLKAVAQACGLSEEAVIAAHLSGDYKVLMYGFAPGYAYMGGVSPDIQVPRKTAPVRDIPAGSVMIAGAQCLVTTVKMPTGWSIIGRSPTPILLDDPARPFLFDIGDTVTFERISVDDLLKAMG